jgi:hypothetical protein
LYLSNYLHVYLSIYLSIYLHLSIYPSTYLINLSATCHTAVKLRNFICIFYFIFSQSRITVQYSMYIQAMYQVHCRPCVCGGPSESDKERETEDYLSVNHKYHLTSYSIYCYSIVSSGAPLFVNFVLINQSLIVIYILLCCI